MPSLRRSRARPDPDSPGAVYMHVRGWLRRSVATGRVRGWQRARDLSAMCTVDTDKYVSPSWVGHVVRREYPKIGIRHSVEILEGLYDRKTTHTEYHFPDDDLTDD